ncbi:MAG: ankyrin repeat domain-containing protein [Sedimentisphaerales bacterium]|nr:ankyrin repeat domain-containing protein [Sedimentisphaerales bacterium]
MEEVRSIVKTRPELATSESGGGMALQRAIHHGHFTIVEFLVDNGADVNATDMNGETALHHASRKGDLEVVSLLLQQGASVNATNHKGQTALHLVASGKNWEIVGQLLSSGANAHIRDRYDNTVLGNALSLGDNWWPKDVDWGGIELLARYHIAGADATLALKKLAVERGLEWPQSRNRAEPNDLPLPQPKLVTKDGQAYHVTDLTSSMRRHLSRQAKQDIKELEGDFIIRIKNPTESAVLAAIRGFPAVPAVGLFTGTTIVCARNLIVPPESTNGIRVPYGYNYGLYFVFGNEPDATYQGDPVEAGESQRTQRRVGAEIQLRKAGGSNYGIRRVE